MRSMEPVSSYIGALVAGSAAARPPLSTRRPELPSGTSPWKCQHLIRVSRGATSYSPLPSSCLWERISCRSSNTRSEGKRSLTCSILITSLLFSRSSMATAKGQDVNVGRQPLVFQNVRDASIGLYLGVGEHLVFVGETTQ